MRLALIGLKGHQSTVLEGARALGDVELVAVADDSAAKLESFMSREPLARKAQRYADWRHLVEHTPMDVCCICDENRWRAEQVIELAARGVHLVTEKPLTTTLNDLARVRAALAKSKSRLTMLLTMRHDAKYAKMRDLVQSGVIGEVCLATAQKSYQLGKREAWFKDRERLGGTIPYIGIHSMDLIRWITGLEFTHVSALHGKVGEAETGNSENQASILARLGNGASATVRLDYQRPGTAPSHGDDRLRIAGTKGVVEIRYPDNGVWLVTGEQKMHLVEPGAPSNLFVDFVKALREGKASRIPAGDCLAITEVVLKARDAADTLKVISLRD
ncbi:MAG: Gfo/Idh/MocA family oxidoreductase [Verrucomicrobiota bacterium]